MEPISDQEKAAQIRKLYELHQSGALSRAEFENAKRRLLGQDPPRMIAHSPPVVQEPRKRPNFGKVILMFAGLLVLVVAVTVLLPDEDVPAVEPTPAPTAPEVAMATPYVEPTATAIPRSGIQTIRLSLVIEGEWKAWGDGCVGGGPMEWAGSETGVVIAPSDASGTFRGHELGTGQLVDDMCQWSGLLTTRASDAYRIKVGDHDAVCHSYMMLPTDDGFFAAVMLNEDGVECATVTDVADSEETPSPS